jgi:hypothetical protein
VTGSEINEAFSQPLLSPSPSFASIDDRGGEVSEAPMKVALIACRGEDDKKAMKRGRKKQDPETTMCLKQPLSPLSNRLSL